MSIPEYKFCPSCQERKHKKEFHTRKCNGTSYLKSYCKQCSNNKNKEKLRSNRHYDQCKCGNKKTKKSPNCLKCRRIDYNKMFTKQSKIKRHTIKRTIIRDNLIKYECSICNLSNSWNNKPITLQLDHINGINNDNRLENLRFLCPNCHSQTETFCGSNKNKLRDKDLHLD